MPRVTLQDVAKMAGVSKMTASRALRGHTDVSAVTRERITKIAKEMDYIPNQIASNFASRSSPMIPMIVPSLSNAVFTYIVENAQAVLHEAGYQMMLVNTDYSLEKEEKAISSMIAWSPSALITSGLEHTEQAKSLLEKAPFPVIEIMDTSAQPIDMAVGFDHFQAGVEMGCYLVERGYRSIAFCGYRIHLDKRSTKRLDGLKQVLNNAGLPEPIILNTNHGYGNLTEDDLQGLVKQSPAIDCIYFSNDDMAVSALLLSQKMSLSVPSDIAIAGFNDIDLGRITTPTLTTTHSPRGLIGKKAAEMAIMAIQGKTIDSKIVNLSSELVPRESA